MTHGISYILSIVPDWVWVLFAAHMVATMPTPKNVWAQWALGGVKWFVGQRVTAMNVFNGMQSEVTAVTNAQKTALEDGSTMKVVKTPEGVLKPIDANRK